MGSAVAYFLKRLAPGCDVADIECGVHTPEDGWCDPNGLLQAFRKKARSLGASYVYDRVVSIDGNGSTLALRLASGAVMHANHVVNAAGAWAKLISAMVGMPLPIEPLRRFE